MNWPAPLTGSHPLASWINQLLRGVKSCEIKSGVGYKVKQGTEGTILEITGGGKSSPATSGNWNYCGTYDPATTSPYMTYDVVQYGTGTSAGMYLCTIDGNNNAPDSGIGWVQVSTGTGTWL